MANKLFFSAHSKWLIAFRLCIQPLLIVRFHALIKLQKCLLLQYYLEPFIIDRKEKFAKISIAVQSLKSNLHIAFEFIEFYGILVY